MPPAASNEENRSSLQAYLPEVVFRLLDTGHFALKDQADELVPLIRDFLKRRVARSA